MWIFLLYSSSLIFNTKSVNFDTYSAAYCITNVTVRFGPYVARLNLWISSVNDQEDPLSAWDLWLKKRLSKHINNIKKKLITIKNTYFINTVFFKIQFKNYSLSFLIMLNCTCLLKGTASWKMTPPFSLEICPML